MHSAAKYGADKFVPVGEYKVHYVEVGKGEPVILIPGSFSTYRAFDRLAPLLSNHYRLLALDYVGTGDSDKPRTGFQYTVQEQAGLIAQMIEKLALGKTHLVGVSYGGAIVLNLAVRHPELVHKVVSIEGGIARPRELPASPFESFLRYPVLGDLFIGIAKTGVLNRVLVKLLAGKWYPDMTADDKRDMLEQIHYNAKSASRTAWYRISISHKTCEDFEEAAKSLKAPVLYLYGTLSDFKEMLLEDNIRFLETWLPHVRIVGIEGGIHDLEFQKPEQVAHLILGFLGEE